MRLYVDDAVRNGVALRHLAVLHTYIIKRVAHDAEVAHRHINHARLLHRAVGILRQPIEAVRGVFVVAARNRPQLPIAVGTQEREVDVDINFAHLLKSVQVNFAHGAVVVGRAVAPAVCHVELVA